MVKCLKEKIRSLQIFPVMIYANILIDYAIFPSALFSVTSPLFCLQNLYVYALLCFG